MKNSHWISAWLVNAAFGLVITACGTEAESNGTVGHAGAIPGIGGSSGSSGIGGTSGSSGIGGSSGSSGIGGTSGSSGASGGSGKATGVTLLGGTDFESATMSSWQNVGGALPGAYKAITDTSLDDLPSINMKAFSFCSQTPAATLAAYHDFSICTPPGASGNWMCAKNLDKDYPNRFVVSTDGSDFGTTYDEFFMEFDFILDSTFLEDFEDQTESGGGWLSLATLVDGTEFPAVMRLHSGIATDDGAQWAIGMDASVCDYTQQTVLVGTFVGAGGSSTSQYSVKSSTDIVGDTPTNVKMYYKLGVGSGGEVKLWIDDVLVVHFTGDTGATGGADNFNMLKIYGSFSDNAPEVPQVGYFDNFYIYDTYTLK